MNMFTYKCFLSGILIGNSMNLHTVNITHTLSSAQYAALQCYYHCVQDNCTVYGVPFPDCTFAGLQDPYETLTICGCGAGIAILGFGTGSLIYRLYKHYVENKKTVSEDTPLFTK